MEANEQKGCGSWSGGKDNFYDYGGYQFTSDFIHSQCVYNADGNGFYSEEFDVSSTATYQVLCPGSFPTPLSVFLCTVEQGYLEYIHTGLKGTETPYSASLGAGTYCFYAEFHPEPGLDQYARPYGGWCTNP